jgi:predicted dehydrogenase
MPDALPVGLIGCGRMGKYHARVYSQLPGVRFAGVYDSYLPNAQAVATQYNCRIYSSIEELIKDVKAVTIATPTEHHLAMAKPCLLAGVGCMVEKPLARNSAECRELLEAAKKGKAVLQVGHVERFNPAVRAIAAMKLSPRFIETVRVSPLTFRSIDVGVVLDVMIHDLDIVLSLAGSKPKQVDATGVRVVGSSEDVCNARVTFENGCVANLTASRLALKTERRLRLAANDCWIAADYAKKQGVIARKGDNLEAIRQTVAKVRTGEVTDPTKLNFADMVKLQPLVVENIDQLTAEQADFVEAVRAGRRPIVSGEDGAAAVELAERIIEAIGAASV